MLRQQNFNSEILNTFQFNFIAELILSDIYSNKNVFLYWKEWSGKSKLVDILASLSEKEMFEITPRYQEKEKEMLSEGILSKTEFFWRTYSYWQETSWNNVAENKEKFKKMLSQAKDINDTIKKEDKVINSNDLFWFKESELNGLKEPYKTIYEAYRTNFQDVFFVALKLDVLRNQNIDLSNLFWILLWTKKILPYKTRYVFLIDNFWGYENNYEKALINQLAEYNAQWIQFIFFADNYSTKVENVDNLLIKEFDTKPIDRLLSQEIIDSFASWNDNFANWLKTNSKEVSATIITLKEWNKFSTNEPWTTENFILELRKNFFENKFSWLQKDFTKKIDLKNLKNSNTDFDLKNYVNKNYWEHKKTELLSKEALQKWFLEIKSKIFWQDKAIKQLLRGIYSAVVRWDTPRGVYMLLGSTWVWKTETVKCISELLYGSREKDKLMIIPMEQYNDISKLNILQGSPKGYVWYDNGKDNLAENLKKMKEGIILFDEIEKADWEVIKALLTTIEEWKMQMGNGEKADLSNFTLLFTSNAIVNLDDVLHSKSSKTKAMRTTKKAEELTDSEIKSFCIDYLIEEKKQKFSPEFLGRFNDFILFNSLTEKQYVSILKKKIKELKETYANIYNEESGIELKDLLDTVNLSEDETHMIIEETMKTKLWARYLNNKLKELVNLHQDKLFNFDDSETNQQINKLDKDVDEDYEKFLKQKEERNKWKDTRLFTVDKLKEYYKNITEKLYWQDEAISSILMAMYSNYANNRKPKWVFMLMWPTGVGKTETARLIAKEVYWSADKLYILPMNQYMSDIDINKLKGTPAGYVGYWDATLKDQLEKMWGSWVLVFDEIEKASPKIIQSLLVALEEWKMEMENVWTFADLTNFTIIFTTNAITDADALIKEFKEENLLNEDGEYVDKRAWNKTIWFDTRSKEEREKDMEKAKEDAEKKSYDFNTYEWKTEFLVKSLKEAINPETRTRYFAPEFLWRMDAFFYYRWFYENWDQDIYINIAEKWCNEQIDHLEATFQEWETDLTKEKMTEFIVPSEAEIKEMIESIAKSKLGIRHFIKLLEARKNKKFKEFMGLTTQNVLKETKNSSNKNNNKKSS